MVDVAFVSYTCAVVDEVMRVTLPPCALLFHLGASHVLVMRHHDRVGQVRISIKHKGFHLHSGASVARSMRLLASDVWRGGGA